MNPRLSSRYLAASGQRGLASLIVVMVLFFVVSLMAAYTNRNLIFEQKTSGNQYRATQAFEASEAGMNWALAMLNGGLVGNDCRTSSAGRSFQQRYLAISATGYVTNAVRTGNWPTCAYEGAQDWTGRCTCPDNTPIDPPATTAAGTVPAFRLWLASPGTSSTPNTPNNEIVGAAPSVAFIQSIGCTRLPEASPGCLDYNPQPQFGDGVGRTEGFVMLRSGLAVPPGAAITARVDVQPAFGLAKLRVENTFNTTNGITVQSGLLSSTAQMELRSVPGTPGERTVVDDEVIRNLVQATASAGTPLTVPERMFVSFFGMRRAVYREQPGLRVCGSPCTAAAINALLAANPNRVIWANGDVTVDVDIGSDTAPVLLVIDNGRLSFANAAAIKGVIYVTGDATTGVATIDLPDAVTSITGAVVAEGSLTTNYTSSATAPTNQLTVSYSPTIVNLVRWTYGSWVRGGGSWRDFPR